MGYPGDLRSSSGKHLSLHPMPKRSQTHSSQAGNQLAAQWTLLQQSEANLACHFTERDKSSDWEMQIALIILFLSFNCCCGWALINWAVFNFHTCDLLGGPDIQRCGSPPHLERTDWELLDMNKHSPHTLCCCEPEMTTKMIGGNQSRGRSERETSRTVLARIRHYP